MCPNCRAFISTSDRVCPYCDMQLGPKAIELRRAQDGVGMPSPHSTSIIILTINIALYVAMTVASMKEGGASLMGFPGQVLVEFGAKYTPSILGDGEWWRLVTAGFLHNGIFHILMNSWVLFDLIAEVEAFYGTSRLLVAYVASTITGFLLSLIVSPGALSVGASAPCFGLIGIMLAVGLRRDNPLAQSVRAYYKRWAIYGVIFSFVNIGGLRIDIAAHIGGLAGGFLVGLVAGLPGHPQSVGERIWRIAAALSVGVTALSFFLDFRQMMRA